MTAVLIAVVVILAFFIALYAIYCIAFKGGRVNDLITCGTLDTPGYKPFAQKIIDGVKSSEQIPYEMVSIKNRGGITLKARLYETPEHRGVLILFHGYRSMPHNDFSGAIKYYIDLGFSIILVHQRAHGVSEGKALSFGILERYDCLDWIEFAQRRFPGSKIALDGISMGAATVLMASGLELPDSVVGILADSGYTSPADIIKKALKQDLKLPVWPCYPLAKLAARIFGGFDLESASPLEAVRNCKKPLFLLHGEADTFVPCDMSRKNFDACTYPEKWLITVPGADHGLSFMADSPRVKNEIETFFKNIGI